MAAEEAAREEAANATACSDAVDVSDGSVGGAVPLSARPLPIGSGGTGCGGTGCVSSQAAPPQPVPTPSPAVSRVRTSSFGRCRGSSTTSAASAGVSSGPPPSSITQSTDSASASPRDSTDASSAVGAAVGGALQSKGSFGRRKVCALRQLPVHRRPSHRLSTPICHARSSSAQDSKMSKITRSLSWNTRRKQKARNCARTSRDCLARLLHARPPGSRPIPFRAPPYLPHFCDATGRQRRQSFRRRRCAFRQAGCSRQRLCFCRPAAINSRRRHCNA